MATPLWKTIAATDQGLCDQFVNIMRFMDPRYRAFNVAQLQEWLTGTDGPYAGDVVAAFGWFPRAEDTTFPTRMQAVLLLRYKPKAVTADLLMVGWTPATPQCEPTYLDTTIDSMLAKGVEWLGTLSPASPVKAIVTTRPHTMGREQVQRLHDRVYVRATAEPPLAGQYIRLIRERVSEEASHWQLQLIA
jgi:hypothetical protein